MRTPTLEAFGAMLEEHADETAALGGLQMPVFGVGAITLDGRYTHGLSRLAEYSDIHDRVLSLMLGYSFASPYGATPRVGDGLPGLPGGP